MRTESPFSPPHRQPAAGRQLWLAVTPARAFALGALLVAMLCVAFSLGRRWPLTSPTWPAEEQHYRPIWPVVRWEQLQVDAGQSAAQAGQAKQEFVP